MNSTFLFIFSIGVFLSWGVFHRGYFSLWGIFRNGEFLLGGFSDQSNFEIFFSPFYFYFFYFYLFFLFIFHLFFHLLNFRARVKYEKLKKSLKKEINFTEKARELQTQIEKLRKRLANSGAKSSDEGSEQRLKTISTELTKVTKELEAQTAKLSEIAAHFRAIKESRKKCFKDAIAAINESLAGFCSLAFDNQIVSSLECANDEPYLHGVEFFWRTVENPDNRVNEINPNYAAALALLIGVAKLKNHRLLVLNNATQDTSCDFVKFLSNQKSLQVVLLSSKLSDEHTNYLVRSIGSSFAFARIN